MKSKKLNKTLKDKILKCAKMADLAYKFSQGDLEWPDEDLIYRVKSDVEVLIKKSKTKIIFSFAGTDMQNKSGKFSLIDWFYNFRVFSKGFLARYKTVGDLIVDMAQNYKEIWITGHSQGASTAYHCAIDLKKSFPDKKILCVPIAPAKVFWFKKDYDKYKIETYTMINPNDPVCALPPFIKTHVGNVIEVEKHSLKDSLFENVMNHYPQDYIDNIERNL